MDWNSGSLMGTIWLCSSPFPCFLLLLLAFFSYSFHAGGHEWGFWDDLMGLFLSPKSYLFSKGHLFSALCTCNLGNSLAAHYSFASFVTVLDYITVQSPSLNHWHLKTTHCFTITRVPDGSSKDWPWIYDLRLQKQSGWGKQAVVILLKHTQTFYSLSLIDPPCVSQRELFM